MIEKEEQKKLVALLLDRHGRTFSAELGIELSSNEPAPLFQWLCASLLMSARISTCLAMRAEAALIDKGWTAANKMADSSWEERVEVLNRAGYARFDENTARLLGDTVGLLIDNYDGDLRRLRAKAGHDPKIERQLLKAFKGIGDVGVDIFFREAQDIWEELYPFAGKKAIGAARALGLPTSALTLADLVKREDFTQMIAALIRAELAGDLENIHRTALA